MPTPDVREVFADQDRDPIPVGLRVGDLVHLSRISGADPGAGALAPDIDGQMHQAFRNLQAAVAAAGATLDEVAQVSIFVADRAHLQAINGPWVQLFPRDDDRPTYKFMVAPLPAGQLVQLEAFAVAGGRRQLVHVPGVTHTNPIPIGVKIGGMVFSSRILPYDPATGAPPEAFADQVRCLFANVRTFLTNAGAEPRHVTQARLFIHDKGDMPQVEPYLQDLFGADRPAVPVVTYGTGTRLQVYLELIASLDR